MPLSKKPLAFIITNFVDELKEIVSVSFNVTGLTNHDNWSSYLGEIENSHLVVLDEVDRSLNLDLEDEEERILLGKYGPYVLVLVRDNDHRLETEAKIHERWVIHHKSRSLDLCLQELSLACPPQSQRELV